MTAKNIEVMTLRVEGNERKHPCLQESYNLLLTLQRINCENSQHSRTLPHNNIVEKILDGKSDRHLHTSHDTAHASSPVAVVFE